MPAAAAPIVAPTSQDLSNFGSLQNQLVQSPTAEASNVDPTTADYQTQLQVNALQTKIDSWNNQQKSLQVYGKQTPSTISLNSLKPPQTNIFGRVLDAFTMPANVIEGATASALGKGASGGQGFTSDILANLHQHNTFGSLLQKEGVNNWVALPLGFSMDLATDPVNWMTGGGESLVPKLVKGLTGGGAEGVVDAAKAWGLSKIDTLANRVPLASKLLVPSEWGRAASGAAANADAAYRASAGLPSVIQQASDISQKGTAASRLADTIGNLAKSATGGETGWGAKFAKAVTFDPNKWWQDTKAATEQTAQEVASGQRASSWASLSDDVRGEAMYGQNADEFARNDLLATQMGDEFHNLLSGSRDALYNPPARGVLEQMPASDIGQGFSDAVSQTNRLNQILGEEAGLNRTSTGIGFVDTARAKINNLLANHPLLDKVAKMYNLAESLFKWGHTSLPGPTYLNTAVGYPIMAEMMGMSTADSGFLNKFPAAMAIMHGNAMPSEIANALSTSEDFQNFLNNYPKNAFSVGFNKNQIERSLSQFSSQDAARMADDFLQGTGMGKQGATAEETLGKVSKMLKEGTGAAPVEDNIAGFSPELFGGTFGQTVTKMRKGEMLWGGAGSARMLPEGMQKGLASAIDTTSSWYNQIHQVYKMTTAMHLAMDGVTGNELLSLAKYIPLAPEDITQAGNLYKLSWMKAGEAANEMYINYAAMPSAVKALRSLPVLGSPFASFSFAMGTKAFQTLLKNPSFYNKVTMLKDEIGNVVPNTPLDKAGLGSQYYNYLNNYSQLKLPFFAQHPVYLNLAAWLPYLGLSAFQNSDRQTSNPTSNVVGQVFDKLPFLKTPEGQVLYDYFIQPYMLHEANATGQFGEPIFQHDDGALQRLVTRPATALATSFSPSWLPPFGYRANQMYNATQGKTSQGIATKQAPAALFLKSALGEAGISVHDMDPAFVQTQIKNILNPSTKVKRTTTSTTTKKPKTTAISPTIINPQ